MPTGLFMFGANEIWRSVDSGATFQHYTTVSNEHWRNNSTDDFFEQSGTPFLAKSGHLIHVSRIGINPKWDETDGSQLFHSTDAGRSFSCMTNAAGNFCTKNNADPNRPYMCEGGPGAYACSSSNISFGGPGDMYPHMLQLRDGRVLLTFTKRCNPNADTIERPACRQDGHGTGLRALLSKDGESWDWSKDYMILSEQDDRYPTVPASGCECGYGK
eukprot:SAG11_NODE_95_length_17051_cov_3.557102_16_plen_216_part_00